MTSFFDKLKKGMTVKDSSPIEENIEQNLSPVLEKEGPFDEIKQQEQTPEEPTVASVLASAPVTVKKSEKNKKREIKKPEKAKKKTAPPENKIEEEKFEKTKIEVIEEKEKFGKEEIKLKKKKWPKLEGQLTIDIYQTNKEVVIQSAIAGIKPEDLDISIENDMITIKGTREKPFEEEEKNYFYQECFWGRFSRKIISPVEIDGSRTKATMKNGVLIIRIPRIDEREKKRKIIVEG